MHIRAWKNPSRFNLTEDRLLFFTVQFLWAVCDGHLLFGQRFRLFRRWRYCYFSWRKSKNGKAANWKCYVTTMSSFPIIGEFYLDAGLAKRVQMIVVTSTGPSLIRIDAFPKDEQKFVFAGSKFNIRSASGEPIITQGKVRLVTKLSRYIASSMFTVSGKLPAPLIMGISFTDKHICKRKCIN